MEGGFHKSLQLFVANGYYLFEDDVCVDLDGKTNHANVPFSKLFVGPFIDRSKVMDEGPDYAISLLSEFYARARCPPMLVPSGGAAVQVYD